ncbi:MAG TPA: hypothetical protein PK919_12490 [Candidatus Aminicenantes bacterium]|nr:hypothetical protein [Candidatus Aminicenantes bacterium]
MRARILAVLLLAALPLAADEAFPLGQVIECLPSLRDPAQSCALYLPSGYVTGKRWPVLYAFDPGGRGAIPVRLFQEAAEKHGWIVVGSNNSRNGPWKDIYEAVWAVWEDTHARLRIDDARVFAAGFSGGARVAAGLARILSIRPAGVIACGAGLAEWLEPADIAGIPWFGTAGKEDFNLKEMRGLERDLRRLGSPCQLRVFAGGHNWPPASLALEAADWLEAGKNAAPQPSN